MDSILSRTVNLTEGGYLQVNNVQLVRSEWSNRQEQTNWQQKVELRAKVQTAMAKYAGPSKG